MALEWYEWECPYCKRIGQVNPAKDYEYNKVMRMECPTGCANPCKAARKPNVRRGVENAC